VKQPASLVITDCLDIYARYACEPSYRQVSPHHINLDSVPYYGV
jgi:hypothetical protein